MPIVPPPGAPSRPTHTARHTSTPPSTGPGLTPLRRHQRLWPSGPGSAARLGATWALCATWALVGWGALSPAAAQMGPGGGGPPGGGRGGAPSGAAAAPRAEESRSPSLEALLPPDPWRAWAQRLAELRPTLALAPAQCLALDDFLRELQQASQFKGQRLLRAVRQRPPAVSALTDVARDLRQEAEDARDWLDTLADLQGRWSALAAALTPAQQDLVHAAYRDSRLPGSAGGGPAPVGARPGGPPPG
jgi:hypothetical protein